MKKLSLALALAVALIPALSRADLTTGYPNGINVGTNASGNRVMLTGTASAILAEISILDIMPGDGFSVPASTSISTGIYLGQATGLTNHAAVICPAVDGVTLTVQRKIPTNWYEDGSLYLELDFHYSGVTLTANAVTITSKAYLNSPSSATTVAAVACAAVNVLGSASYQIAPTAITSTALEAGAVPGDLLTFKVTVDGTSCRKEILGARLRGRPKFVLQR